MTRCVVGIGQLGLLRPLGQGQEEFDGCTGYHTSLPEKH